MLKLRSKKEKLSYTSGIKLNDGTIIRELEQEEVYKYLGVNEGSEIKHAMMKEKLRKECIRRVRIIMKKNRIEFKKPNKRNKFNSSTRNIL